MGGPTFALFYALRQAVRSHPLSCEATRGVFALNGLVELTTRRRDTITITVARDLKPDRTEREQLPTHVRDPADTTHEELEDRSFDPSQSRRISSLPYDDLTRVGAG
jgi:hypothetical protein